MSSTKKHSCELGIIGYCPREKKYLRDREFVFNAAIFSIVAPLKAPNAGIDW